MSGLPTSADIRQFLNDTFSDEELVIFCYDYFREAHDTFADDLTKSRKIQHLIEYCERRDATPSLLAAIQRARPEQYRWRFPHAPQVSTRYEPAKPVRDPKQVFISHAHEDAEFAHRLADDLRQNGWHVWIAPDSIHPGEKWAEAIERGLGESGVFAVALTCAAVQSRWVRDETFVAIELEKKGQMRFTPLAVEPCDVPYLWSTYQHIPFQGDYGRGLTDLLDALEPERRIRREREAQERAAREKAERLERERLAREQATREEAERQAKLAAEKAEAERLERERKEREAQERARQLEVERQAKLAAQKVEAERKALEKARQDISRRERAQALRKQVTAALAQVRRVPWYLWVGVVTLILLIVLVPLAAQPVANLFAPPPGATRIAEKDGMVMIYIPAGEFTMGSAEGDKDADSDEKPQHQVYLDAFWIDHTEVTNAQYKKCVQDEKCKASSCADNTSFNDDNQPVVCVDWNDAKTYCEWVGRQLPTEAQWEKAARGTDGRIYPWGNQTATCDYAVMNDGSGYGCGKGNVAWAVGSKSKGISPYGALDMAGNVWEWTADWYDDKYYDSSATKNPNPQGPASGQYHVLRGGSWGDGSQNVRAASRGWYPPEYRFDFVGFRCSR